MDCSARTVGYGITVPILVAGQSFSAGKNANSTRKDKLMSISREKRLERAQMRVLFTVPFFAPGVAKLPVVWDDKIPTACTDGKEIRWNPGFFDKMKDQELVTVLCHEVCHCMLGHLWRAPGGVDWEIWNQATDHAVNNMLKEFSEQVTAKRLADPFPFPEPADAYCCNPAFRDKSEEEIYTTLFSKKQQQPQPANGKAGSGQSGQAGGCSGSGGSGKTPPGSNQGPSAKPDPGSMPAFGQMSQPSQGQAAQAKKLANDWDGTLIQACQMAQGRGELPGGMSRFVEELVSNQVPWYEILRSWLREQCSDDYNFLEPAMEWTDSGFILPSLKSDKMGPVVFATDTSGSINNELLGVFQSDKQNCLDEMKPSKLVDIYCDSRIHKIKEYAVGDHIDRDAPGGGSTDFRPVFTHVEGMDVPPKCIVYLTDLDGSFPTDPGVPCLWVTWSKGQIAPFGQTVYAGH